MQHDGVSQSPTADSAAPENQNRSMLDILPYMMPVLAAFVFLAATRVFPNRSEYVGTTDAGDVQFASPTMWRVVNAGAGLLDRRFSWIFHRGTLLLIFGLLAPAFVPEPSEPKFQPDTTMLSTLRR